MARRWALGAFEHLVLLAILRLGEEAYAPGILDEIEAQTGQPPSRGSIYVTLDRLEDKGFIRSETESGTPARSGRPRRRVELTRDGAEVLEETREGLLNMWSGVEERLGRA